MREDWIECVFAEVVSIVSGKNQKKVIDSDGKYPIYGSGGIIGQANEYLCESGTTIIGRKGTINSPIYVKEKFWNVDTAFGFHPLSILNNRLLYFFCIHFNFKKLDKSTTIPSLAKRDLLKIPFPLPPLVEQKAIVKKIEELFSSLDSGIADLKKAQEKLEIYRQAVLKKAFEGELTKEWREKQTNLPSADELLEQIKEERQNYCEQELSEWKDAVKLWKNEGANDKKPAKPKFIKELISLTDEELEKLPTLNKYWHWVKADKIASHESSSLKAGPFGSSLKKEFYTESGYKIYGQEQVIANNYNIGNYYVKKEKYDSLINCSIKPYDILISLVGTVGKVLVLPKDCEDGIINPRLVKISLNKFYDSIFFKYYFESAFLKSLYSLKAHGATMDILNLGIIKELPYPLCSKQEQHQIVQEIESRLSVCDTVEKDIGDSLEKAQALRQSILKKAFEGKLLSEEEIAKCKADKEYEPASVLLEKIKAEKKKK
tara:strand:- start:29873 stop:31339 length:1467 start_codon:yes stop_codon:yes gene_type:complete